MPHAPRHSRRKHWLFFMLMIVFVVLIAEGLSILGLSALKQTWYTSEDIAAAQQKRWEQPRQLGMADLAQNDLVPHMIDQTLLHPYLGYIAGVHTERNDPRSLTNYGFREWTGRFISEDIAEEDDIVSVGIFGGSVAESLGYNRGKESLRVELQRLPAFRNRHIEVSTISMGGYKEPQQALALMYLLSQGMRLDIAITLDGFNEITLPTTENLRKGVHISYPRGWYYQAQGLNPEYEGIVAEFSMFARWRSSIAQFFHYAPLRWSVTAGAVWHLIDHVIAQQMHAREVALLELRDQPTSYAVTGPMQPTLTGAVLFDALTAQWERGTRLFQELSNAHGIRSYHFLQPNQYIKGSKPIGPEEERIALNDTLRAPYIPQGYAALQTAGERLRKDGVQFHDLTMIFVDHEEPLYIDNCCHVSDEGNAIMGTAIGEVITEDLRRTPLETNRN